MSTYSPRLSGGMPEGWVGKGSITLLSPDGQANVIAASEPVDPSIDSETYATVQGDVLREQFPGYSEISVESGVVLGGDGYRRTFEWEPPDGTRVTQIQAYRVAGSTAYTATATTPSERFGLIEPILRMVVDSISVPEPGEPKAG